LLVEPGLHFVLYLSEFLQATDIDKISRAFVFFYEYHHSSETLLKSLIAKEIRFSGKIDQLLIYC
jgi:hypothetical protein